MTILVSGLINIEVNLKVDSFPIEYCPIIFDQFGVDISVSGVGFNIAKALTTLGSKNKLLSLIGKDGSSNYILDNLKKNNISNDRVIPKLRQTPQSVNIYDQTGRRQINLDLKDIEKASYPLASFDEALLKCDIAALCNISFSKPFLERAKKQNKVIATDVHVISDINDPHDSYFMKSSDLLFMSDEALKMSPEQWASKVLNKYGPKIIVIGLGAKGALLCVKDDNFIERIPACTPRPIVNTIGAGDALFSAFLHFYTKTKNPYISIEKAIIFAGWKIGESGAANGFLSEEKLNEIYESSN